MFGKRNITWVHLLAIGGVQNAVILKFQKRNNDINDMDSRQENVYEMYIRNDYHFGFWIVRNSWGTLMAKVTGIEGVKEGEKIKGKHPYYNNPAVEAELYYQTEIASEKPGKFKEKYYVSGPGTFSYRHVNVK
ncbi:MAG: hypothetical protein ABJF65_00240 [Reichenbachiella sp.]|uniref:hypothetical protein n=1 Tax=Reichenbachiella sp. TaxID=2184521 RepID=UPI00326341C9